MEADSTTLDNSSKDGFPESMLPFTSHPSNLILFKELTNNCDNKSLEIHLVDRLQTFGLIPKQLKCPTGQPGCRLIKKTARVIDKIQWACEGCGKRQPIRTGSFFLRIQCSLLQTLQIILAWCEDADCDAAAQHFGVKCKVANMIYEKLDKLAAAEQDGAALGGAGSAVLAELYPDCLTRRSPDTTDTTDRPHVHRVLMIADTKHVPTRYHLHVIKDDLKNNASSDYESLKAEIEEVLAQKTLPDSFLVTGSNVPPIEGASSLQQLLQYCDNDMQHFLHSRIWRQALTLCAAGRSLCTCAGDAGGGACARAVGGYLRAALHRHAHAHHYYRHMLALLAREYTDHCHEETDGDSTVVVES